RRRKSSWGWAIMTYHEFFQVLQSVCEHSDYRLLLGTTRQVSTNHSWDAMLRHSKSGAVTTVSVSEQATADAAVEDVLRQLAVRETVSRQTHAGGATPRVDRQRARGQQRP